MTIVSLKFLAFIAMISLIYFVMPKKVRWITLLLASYVYYFISSKTLTVYLIITTISVYLSARGLEKIDIKLKKECEGKDKQQKKELKNKAKKTKKY